MDISCRLSLRRSNRFYFSLMPSKKYLFFCHFYWINKQQILSWINLFDTIFITFSHHLNIGSCHSHQFSIYGAYKSIPSSQFERCLYHQTLLSPIIVSRFLSKLYKSCVFSKKNPHSKEKLRKIIGAKEQLSCALTLT